MENNAGEKYALKGSFASIAGAILGAVALFLTLPSFFDWAVAKLKAGGINELHATYLAYAIIFVVIFLFLLLIAIAWRKYRAYLREIERKPEPPGEPHRPTPYPTTPNIDLTRIPTGSARLVGRTSELHQLQAARDDTRTAALAIVAAGGVGKSALTRAWLDEIVPDLDDTTRAYGWSFYSQGQHQTATSSTEFFEKALRFFGHEGEIPKDEIEKARALERHVRARPTLLILDGMEPLQHPLTVHRGEIADTAIKEFLRVLVRNGPIRGGLVVISSRQPIVEHKGKAGFATIDLTVLNDDDGANLLASLGVVGPRAELATASHEMGGHALALVLLGRALKEHYNGHVERRDRLPDILDDPEEGSHANRILRFYDEYFREPEFLARSYKNLEGDEAPERILLRLMGLFDRPMELSELRELLAKSKYARPLSGLTHDERERLETRLEAAGLLLPRPKPGGERLQYGTHPLIRDHFGRRFRRDNPAGYTEVHLILFEYLQSVPAKRRPDTLEELEPLYRAVVHGCLAGEYQKAMDDVYWDRIQRCNEGYRQKKIGAFARDLTSIAGFFPEGWEQPVATGLSEAEQGWLLAEASYCLMLLGRLEEALAPRRIHMKISEQLKDWEGAGSSAENLTDLLLPLGRLAEAKAAAEQAITFADKSDDLFQKLCGRAKLGSVLHRLGALDEARRIFEEAEALQRKCQPELPRLYGLQGAQFCALLLDLALEDAEREAVLERGRYALEVSMRNNWLLAIAMDHLTIARALYVLARAAAASTEFDAAVAGLRKAGSVEELPPVLLARAEFLRAQGVAARAFEDLEEAQEIIDRCGMQLFAVDAALLRGRLLRDAGNEPEAREAFAMARELVKVTGYALRAGDCEYVNDNRKQEDIPKNLQPTTNENQEKNMSKKHLFISYCRDNLSEVEQLHDELIAAGETVWWDQDILPGQDWRLEIKKAMKESYAVVVCLSEEAVKRERSGIYPEIRDAIDAYRQYAPGTIFLIPVRLSKCTIPPMEIDGTKTLDGLQYVDLFPPSNRQAGLDRLKTALKAASGRKDAGQQAAVKTVGPTPPPAATTPRKHNLPPRNLYFRGRARQLGELRESLVRERKAGITQAAAISGFGGIGKTQTALEYAWLHLNEYDHLYWVNAQSRETIQAGYAEIARRLDLSEKDEADLGVIVNAVLRWLETNANWLLIYDNADQPDELEGALPADAMGHILITSRAAKFGRLGIKALPLEKLEPKEALEFLFARTERTRTQAEERAAAVLASELDCLPLALEQAGAYIACSAHGFGDYLTSYRARRLELLEESRPLMGQYGESVVTTWRMNFDEVVKSSQAAGDILNLCAFFAPAAIPYELLTSGASEAGCGMGGNGRPPSGADLNSRCTRAISLTNFW